MPNTDRHRAIKAHTQTYTIAISFNHSPFLEEIGSKHIHYERNYRNLISDHFYPYQGGV